MEVPLGELGVELVPRGAGVELRGGDRDWVRAVLVAFGHRAEVRRDGLWVPAIDAAAAERAVRAALCPRAVLFDLDGVLADIAGRRALADPADVEAIAARYATGVVTTCPRRLADSVLVRYGFAPHIDVVVGSDDGPCKPDPFPVRFAMQQLGVSTAWMLGDNPSDVTAARHGGAVPFAIRPRGIGGESHEQRLRGAGAVRLVDSVAELRRLLP
ncbi:MAG TPA: HAD family hydrolase [bacterium]|nr:HAD family hydrolase [bacterium]